MKTRRRHRHLPQIPDFDGAILTSCDEPLAFAVKTDCSDVGVMTFECDQLHDSDLSERCVYLITECIHRGGRRVCNLVDVHLLVDGRCKEPLAGAGLNTLGTRSGGI